MGVTIWWANVREDLTYTESRGEWMDQYGQANDGPALGIGDGLVLEAPTRDAMVTYLRRAADHVETSLTCDEQADSAAAERESDKVTSLLQAYDEWTHRRDTLSARVVGLASGEIDGEPPSPEEWDGLREEGAGLLVSLVEVLRDSSGELS